MQDSGKKRVCTACIGDEHFSELIKILNQKGKCDFDESHGRRYPTISIEELAKEVDDCFRNNYVGAESYFGFWQDSEKITTEYYGKPYLDIITEDILGVEAEIADDINENLPDDYCLEAGEHPFYDEDKNYELVINRDRRNLDDDHFLKYWYKNKFEHDWNEFCKTVKFGRRYTKIEPLLNELFGKAEIYSRGRTPPVYELPEGVDVYRARILQGITIEKIQENPQKELGCPNKEITKAGRMNVECIPAFYAAFNRITALSETRPGIGEEVAIGRFTLKKPFKVFDFTVFSRALSQNDYSVEEHSRYLFIMEMQEAISRPISPFQMSINYIPTQIIAEYLKEHFGCEAIIYKSAMHKAGNEETRNIVIFNPSAEEFTDRVQYVDLSLSEVENVIYKSKEKQKTEV